MSKINKLGQYKGVEVKVNKQVVTQEEIDNQIKALLAQKPTLEEKDGEVSNGDVTTIDFEGFKDGIAFDGGKAEGHQLEIGSGQFIPGFEDQMIGMKKGETRELNLTFPENYGAPDLAGADVVFKVTVHKIETKKESELNDEFVVSLNIPEMQTVADLYESMKANIQAQHDQAYQAQKETAIFDKILADSDVEIDDSELQKALEKHIQHISMQLAQQGMQLEQYLQMMGVDETAFRQQIEPSAKQQAIFEAIIDEIINVENIETSDEEVDQQVESIASYNKVSKEEVLQKINPEGLRHDFNRVKASRLIAESAIVTE
ncbi:trigger factor [Thomasclavelia cocleata]|uniref:peptidylprolyl isomerase n=1 Tax=Thomasclavelia cocleata TaxID=69824 RepID=A0A829Z7D0_9FIRM|nr:trigger factor [Thomasclavelia cocleata]GFI40096.1 trigger factor [Thomasclavelia cocleata]